MIPERLAALREKMRAYGVDAYLVPTADYHESEYVGTYFKARTYITGFTGSACLLYTSSHAVQTVLIEDLF